MSAATVIALALAAAAVVAIIGYAWGAARGRRMSDDLLVVAVIALIASCSTVPKAVEVPLVSIKVKP